MDCCKHCGAEKEKGEEFLTCVEHARRFYERKRRRDEEDWDSEAAQSLVAAAFDPSRFCNSLICDRSEHDIDGCWLAHMQSACSVKAAEEATAHARRSLPCVSRDFRIGAEQLISPEGRHPRVLVDFIVRHMCPGSATQKPSGPIQQVADTLSRLQGRLSTVSTVLNDQRVVLVSKQLNSTVTAVREEHATLQQMSQALQGALSEIQRSCEGLQAEITHRPPTEPQMYYTEEELEMGLSENETVVVSSSLRPSSEPGDSLGARHGLLWFVDLTGREALDPASLPWERRYFEIGKRNNCIRTLHYYFDQTEWARQSKSARKKHRIRVDEVLDATEGGEGLSFIVRCVANTTVWLLKADTAAEAYQWRDAVDPCGECWAEAAVAEEVPIR